MPDPAWAQKAAEAVEDRLPWVSVYVRLDPRLALAAPLEAPRQKRDAVPEREAWLHGHLDIRLVDVEGRRAVAAVTLHAVPDDSRRWTPESAAAAVAHEVGHLIWGLAAPEARARYGKRDGGQTAYGREEIVLHYYLAERRNEEFFADDFAAWIVDPGRLSLDAAEAVEAVARSAEINLKRKGGSGTPSRY